MVSGIRYVSLITFASGTVGMSCPIISREVLFVLFVCVECVCIVEEGYLVGELRCDDLNVKLYTDLLNVV